MLHKAFVLTSILLLASCGQSSPPDAPPNSVQPYEDQLISELTFYDAALADCVSLSGARTVAELTELICSPYFVAQDMTTPYAPIQSLQGIEALRNLETLNLPGNAIVSADLSKLHNLKSIILIDNELE